MKSEKAREHIARNVFRVDNDAFLPPIITRDNCNKAVELAEQEAEEQMRQKSVEAFKSTCVYKDGCGGAGRDCDPTLCEDLRLFIQKLNEE